MLKARKYEIAGVAAALVLGATGAMALQPSGDGADAGTAPAQPPAATPGAPASTAAPVPAAPVKKVVGDTVTMVDGTKLVAPILKETNESIWIDLGYEVVEVPRVRIESIERAKKDETVAEAADTNQLFRTAKNLVERTPKELAKMFGGAVIKVSTPGGLGSGFIISPDGHAITNAHVVQGERKIKVTVYEQSDNDFRLRMVDDVEIVAVNDHLDLAMIKLRGKDGEKFPTVYIQSEEELAAGQDVFAIGAPLGLERTLSRGVISTTQRSFEGLTYIQTDTQINPGNSGGPLFNDRGEVIGVTNMGIPLGEGLNFAIPARYVKDFIRNRDAFAFNRDNPNSGYSYNDPPKRQVFTVAPVLEDASVETGTKR